MTRLIIVAGEPGVGKSFVSEEISKRLYPSLRHATDDIRNNLFESPTHSEFESQKTYDEMFYQARQTLVRGEHAILDATFSMEKGRVRSEFIAERHNADFTIVRVHCNDWDELRSRLEARPDDGAGIDVHRSIRDRFDPILRDRVDIFNHRSKEDTIDQIESKVL